MYARSDVDTLQLTTVSNSIKIRSMDAPLNSVTSNNNDDCELGSLDILVKMKHFRLTYH